MFRPSAAQMVQFFSDFLNDVSQVLRNLKNYAYELASIPTPHPKLDHVYHSMSSIILSAHRTFQDLKHIQAVLSGLAQARRTAPARYQHEHALSHASTSCRSRTEEQEVFFSPRKKKTQSGLAFFSFADQQEETVKTRKIIKREDESSFSFENETVRRTRKLETATPIKQLQPNKGEQPQTPPSNQQDMSLLPLTNLQSSIESRLRNLVSSSRQLHSRLSQRSQQCLQLLCSVRQELTVRG